MAHNEPPHQDLRCLQIQLFSSLVVKELRVRIILENVDITYKCYSCVLSVIDNTEKLFRSKCLKMSILLSRSKINYCDKDIRTSHKI